MKHYILLTHARFAIVSSDCFRFINRVSQFSSGRERQSWLNAFAGNWSK